MGENIILHYALLDQTNGEAVSYYLIVFFLPYCFLC